MQATAGSHAVVHVDRDLTAGVVSLCSPAGATLNSALLTVWSALLLHLSGQTDVVVGVPHSMRYGAATHGPYRAPRACPSLPSLAIVHCART